MGNQLTTIVPSQVWPVEQYINDLPNFVYIENLGSTRFFKVAKAKNKEGLVVIKIFVLLDPTLQLQSYKDQIENMKNYLNLSFNCLSFQQIIQSEKAIMLCRQYIQYSLYDRISTRPFFSLIEKKWISFLLLVAVNQSHKLNIYHGDIKSENIMITSWNWLYLTDFANFKPVYLPDNNPADFSFYFDTSRRRTCYLAPERFFDGFYKSGPSDEPLDNFDPTIENVKSGELSSAMDIFSVGCVLIELFNEGAIPFDLSQLLAYRSGDYYPKELIDLIEDGEIKKLVEHMIQKDASLRFTAEKYLKIYKGKVFPDCFYSFLQPYCQRFTCSPLLYADERVLRIDRDFDLIKQKLIDEIIMNKFEMKVKNENLLILLSVITSSFRTLHLCNSKLIALNLLRKFATYFPSDIILDRILPYVLFFVRDKYSLVKCETIHTLVYCLSRINFVPQNDVSIFTEYIFPSTNYFISDNDTIVRIVFAKNIAHIAELAIKFVELIQLYNEKKTVHNLEKHKLSSDFNSLSSQKHSSYDSEVSTLHDFIQQKVVLLLGDKDNAVKKALLENGINQLCIFFGRKRANDVLFSHMITYLNDKHDWQLRGLFFDSMVGIAAYIGWQCSSILKPLIQQGLSDPEEFVVFKAICSLCCLIKLNLVPKIVMINFMHETMCLILHPNIWIQRKVIGLIYIITNKMDLSDVTCYLKPFMSKYFTQCYNEYNELVLIESMRPPLSRVLYQQLVKCPYPWDFFVSTLIVKPKESNLSDAQQSSLNFLKKLSSQGMLDSDVNAIVLMSNYLEALNKAQKSDLVKQEGLISEKFNGSVNLLTYLTNSCKKLTTFYPLNESKLKETPDLNDVQKIRFAKRNKYVDSQMNEDWRQMFNPSDPPEVGPKNLLEPSKQLEKYEKNQNMQANLIITEKVKTNEIKTIVAWCRSNLDNLQTHMKNQYSPGKCYLDSLDVSVWDDKQISCDWKPQGIMVAHLHEHRGAVNRILVCQNNRFLASCSNDGCIKLWDSSRLDGKSVTNRSKLTYNKLPGQIKSICFAQNSQSLIATSDTGSMHVFKIDPSNSRVNTILTKDLDVNKNGLIIEMMPIDHQSENVIAFVTVHGLIFGWDLRTPQKNIWQIETDPKLGLITSFDINRKSNWIICGTSSGNHTCWDMRFFLPVNNISHPNGARVKRLIVDEGSPSLILSSSHGNNELSFWDVETGARQKVLWASPTPIFGYTSSTKHFFSGIFATSSFVLTAGSDMRIRYWNLNYPSESYIVAGSSSDSKEVNSLVSYNSRLVEATQAIYESYHIKRPSISSFSEETVLSPYISVGHRDIITDLTVCISSQHYVITSSRDGIIKVWK